MLCFQTSTQVTLVLTEDWILGHGLLSTFFFPSTSSCDHVPSHLPKDPLSEVRLDSVGQSLHSTSWT